MLSALRLLIAVTFLLNLSWACNENRADSLTERQDFGVYLNPYQSVPWNPYYYNYQSGVAIPEYMGTFESRTPTNYYFKNSEENSQNPPADTRAFGSNAASLINSVLFNNRFTTPTINPFRPFAGLFNQLPVQANPNFANPLYDSCTSPSGESGVCASGSVCSLFGGRPSGSCPRAKVCCINAITTCGGSITLNNTYWQSPSTAVSSPSTCSLTVKLDTSFVEQKRPICQVRLDLVSFVIDQPTTSTLCSNDNFQVGGAASTPPTICGDNSGQHMYIEVSPSDTKPSDIQLLFNFGSTAATRSWNIKIAMLPCGASYLAPSNCLQYFTSTTGKVSSFNWKDETPAAGKTRQLAGQNYNICFRTELISSSQKAAKMCLTTCSTTPNAFSLTTPAAKATDPVVGATCAFDFLLFSDGENTSGGVSSRADRFCGGAFNPSGAANAASVTTCSTMKPFKITYVTNEKEDGSDAINTGFCFSFQEQSL